MSAMAMGAHAPRGFTLIELMTAITLFAILTMLAMPMYTTFIQNTQIRTASESILTGLRLAQTEALKRNVTVEFVLDPAVGWEVDDVSDKDNVSFVSKAEFKQGAPNADVVPTTDARRVAFNGLGRIVGKSPIDDTAPIAQIDVASKLSYSSPRALRVLVGNAGSVRLCDPQLANTDPAGCP